MTQLIGLSMYNSVRWTVIAFYYIHFLQSRLGKIIFHGIESRRREYYKRWQGHPIMTLRNSWTSFSSVLLQFYDMFLRHVMKSLLTFESEWRVSKLFLVIGWASFTENNSFSSNPLRYVDMITLDSCLLL